GPRQTVKGLERGLDVTALKTSHVGLLPAEHVTEGCLRQLALDAVVHDSLADGIGQVQLITERGVLGVGLSPAVGYRAMALELRELHHHHRHSLIDSSRFSAARQALSNPLRSVSASGA